MKNLLYILPFLSFVLSSCWPNDDIIEPYYETVSEGVKLNQIPISIYDNEVFFSITNNKIAAYNENSAWDIAFDTRPDGHKIILNSADLLEVANLGQVNFATTNSVPENAQFNFDASSGNTDSLVFKDWINTETSPYTYSNNLYIIGKQTGLNYTGLKKIIITNVTTSTYTMLIGNMNSIKPDTVVIEKDADLNFVSYKIINELNKVDIEPEKTEWDIRLTQYSSILFTDDGIATKYSVRGALINPYNTQVAKFYIHDSVAETEERINASFSRIDSTLINSIEFKNSLDIIGYDWKDVTIDEASNNSVYKTDLRKIYIVQTQANTCYKLRFTSFYNNAGLKGYPAIEFAQIK